MQPFLQQMPSYVSQPVISGELATISRSDNYSDFTTLEGFGESSQARDSRPLSSADNEKAVLVQKLSPRYIPVSTAMSMPRRRSFQHVQQATVPGLHTPRLACVAPVKMSAVS